MGRDEIYNPERFLHELSFAHRSPVAIGHQEGIWGTAGSVSSKRLFFDFLFRKEFDFENQQNAFLLAIQRSEDLDGAYQRQLIGFRHNLTHATALWLQGDVYADKAQTDIYFSARHHFSPDHWVHASWILPDAYFNQKTKTAEQYGKVAHSLFLRWHREDVAAKSLSSVSLTLSPEFSFMSQRENLMVASKSLQAALFHQKTTGFWAFEFASQVELTKRTFQFFAENDNFQPGFEREHIELRAQVRWLGDPLQPVVGLAYMSLSEQGYFGRAMDDDGDVQRREPFVYFEVRKNLSANTSVSPAIYLSRPDIQQAYREQEDVNFSGFSGKLALPLVYTLGQGGLAQLTFNPTFYLHKFAFGGGNVQLHWPL